MRTTRQITSLCLLTKKVVMLAHRYALTATGKESSYSIISADALAYKIRRTLDELRSKHTHYSEHVLRRTSKQMHCPGKLYDPFDHRVELFLHIQWVNTTHASYFAHHTDQEVQPTTDIIGDMSEDASSGSPCAPMSQIHFDAQIELVRAINSGIIVKFVMKCNYGVHKLTIFETRVGMKADSEVYIPKTDSKCARRLDVCICGVDGEVLFNPEILHASRTREDRRDDDWAELNAIYVLDALRNCTEHDLIELICEPRHREGQQCKECEHDRQLREQHEEDRARIAAERQRIAAEAEERDASERRRLAVKIKRHEEDRRRTEEREVEATVPDFIKLKQHGLDLHTCQQLFPTYGGILNSSADIPLQCPWEQRMEVANLGARWDPFRRSWYVPAGADLTPFARWTLVPQVDCVRAAHLMVRQVRNGAHNIRGTPLNALWRRCSLDSCRWCHPGANYGVVIS